MLPASWEFLYFTCFTAAENTELNQAFCLKCNWSLAVFTHFNHFKHEIADSCIHVDSELAGRVCWLYSCHRPTLDSEILSISDVLSRRNREIGIWQRSVGFLLAPRVNRAQELNAKEPHVCPLICHHPGMVTPGSSSLLPE